MKLKFLASLSSVPEPLENVAPLVTGNFRKFKLEFFIQRKALLVPADWLLRLSQPLFQGFPLKESLKEKP